MRLVVVTDHPTGRRVHVAGRRIHHGLVGIGLTTAGAVLCWLDRRDFRCWLTLSD